MLVEWKANAKPLGSNRSYGGNNRESEEENGSQRGYGINVNTSF